MIHANTSARGVSALAIFVIAGLVSVSTAPSAAADDHDEEHAIETIEKIGKEVPGLRDHLDSTSADDGVEHDLDIPEDPEDDLTIAPSSLGLRIGLPGDGEHAETSANGDIIFREIAEDTDLVLQPQNDGGVRMITVIGSEDSPSEFEFPVGLRAGQSLISTPRGGAAVIAANGNLLIEVPPPWAFDANGDAVSSSYRIDDNILTLEVDHDDDTAYPVIADPWWKRVKAAMVGAVKGGGAGAVGGFVAGLGVCVTTGIGCLAAPAFVGVGTLVGSVGGGAYCAWQYRRRGCRSL